MNPGVVCLGLRYCISDSSVSFLVLVQVFYSVNLLHLHSWCLQRSTQTKGGEQWCFLQASEAQPTETPCEVTTCIPSEGCSSSREMERPLNLKSRKQPSVKRKKRRKKKKIVYKSKRSTKPVLRQNLL